MFDRFETDDKIKGFVGERPRFARGIDAVPFNPSGVAGSDSVNRGVHANNIIYRSEQFKKLATATPNFQYSLSLAGGQKRLDRPAIVIVRVFSSGIVPAVSYLRYFLGTFSPDLLIIPPMKERGPHW